MTNKEVPLRSGMVLDGIKFKFSLKTKNPATGGLNVGNYQDRYQKRRGRKGLMTKRKRALHNRQRNLRNSACIGGIKQFMHLFISRPCLIRKQAVSSSSS